VDCMAFSSLIHKYDVSHVDFLQIDVEGYDFDIIKMIDFDSLKPKIIRYEWVNLSAQDNLLCAEYLVDRGYSLFDDGLNVIACLG
jgi:hypothetical protein